MSLMDISYSYILFPSVVLLLFSIRKWYRILHRGDKTEVFNRKKGEKGVYDITSNIPPIGEKFSWSSEEPRPIRPFANKKNFNVSMGISNLAKTPEDWLLIENTYCDNTKLRKTCTEKYPDKTVHVYDNEISRLALREFYSKTVKFLLDRFPQYFVVKDNWVNNLINGEKIPLDPKSATPNELLLYLAANIEEDFLILIKDDPTNPEEEYKLRASVTGFPAGFDPSHGHDQPISVIHSPVPQYQSRLKISMSRFFNRLEPKDMWVRHNWSIQTHKAKFSLSNNHAYDGQDVTPLTIDEIDFEEACFLRVERQVFSRMPESRANFMTVRTYLTPIKKIKEEGLAEDLCRAIDGLPEDLAFYKKRGAWGDAVKQYLRQ